MPRKAGEERDPNVKRAIAFIVVIGGISLGGLIWLATRFFDAPFVARGADDVVVAYKKAGLPWEAKDLAPNPPIAKDENAAPFIVEAGKGSHLKQFSKEEKELFGMAQAGKYKQVQQRLVPYAATIRLAEQAAERPRLDFGRDWDKGPLLEFSENADIRNLVKLLCLMAQLEAGQGEPDECFRDLRHAWLLSRLPRDEPVLICMLVSITDERITLDAVSRCAALLKDEVDFLKNLRRLLAESGPPPDIAKAMRGEAYFHLASLRNLDLMRAASDSEDVEATQMPQNLRRTGLPADIQAKAFTVRFMQMWTEGKPILDRVSSDPGEAGKAWDNLGKKWEERKSMSNMLNGLLFPTFGEAWRTITARQAEIVVNQALIEALLYRTQEGDLPTRIDELEGKWVDPFTKKPLRIKRTKDSIRIYSLSWDRQDNGGTAKREIRGAKQFDIVARYPPRTAKP